MTRYEFLQKCDLEELCEEFVAVILWWDKLSKGTRTKIRESTGSGLAGFVKETMLRSKAEDIINSNNGQMQSELTNT